MYLLLKGLRHPYAVLLGILLATIPTVVPAQGNRAIDSLSNALRKEKEDTNKVTTLLNLAESFIDLNGYDSSFHCADAAENLSQKLGYKKGVARSIMERGRICTDQENYPKAIEFFKKCITVFHQINDQRDIGRAYANIGVDYEDQGIFASALEYHQKAMQIDELLADKFDLASDYGNIGNIYADQGDYAQALENQLKALAIDEESGDKKSIAIDCNCVGNIYQAEGIYSKVLEYYFKALSLFQEIGFKKGVATLLGNIGIVYRGQNNFASALEYENKALAMCIQIGDKDGTARNYGNIGNIYALQNNYPKAIEYDSLAVVLYGQVNDRIGLARNIGNIGGIYDMERNNKKSLEYNLRAIGLFRDIGDKEGLSRCYAGAGISYTKLKLTSLAHAYLDSSLNLAKSIGANDNIENAYSGLTTLDSVEKNYKAEVDDFRAFVTCRDSMLNQANTKKIMQAQMEYDFEQKQSAQEAEQARKDAIADQEKKKELVIRNSFIGGFILTLALAFFIFRGYRQKQKDAVIITAQKVEVEKQKQIVEEKNRDIVDSINYAKRLQDAILPPISIIKKQLPESFVLYRPKDIVAGDFYWMEFIPSLTLPTSGESKGSTGSFSPPVGRTQEGMAFIAACDCTGHGVPGALVSVVCSNALNRAVKEFRITDTGKILDKVRELVLETFEKSEGDVKDGMDISLASITSCSQGEGTRVRLQWSGAYNSLWYMQNGELKEIAGDKQPIGKHDNPKPFTTHTITLIPPLEGHGEAGTCLYLFTDGYADQFGGPKGKKFKYKQLQEKLSTISNQPMEEQKKLLEQTLDEWKGNLEQTDDICIIGIKL